MEYTKRMREDQIRGRSKNDIRRGWTRTKNTKKNRRKKKNRQRKSRKIEGTR